MSVVEHTIVHTLYSPMGDVHFETSIDSEDDAMTVWFIPINDQGIKEIAIHNCLVLSKKQCHTDRDEAREIWNRLIAMGFTTYE